MLDISNLTCGYDSGFAIRNINLRVPAGEIIGIIGPNGSGKTTLLRAITRSLKPAIGVICLEGEDIRRMKTRDLARKIAVVSQSAESGLPRPQWLRNVNSLLQFPGSNGGRRGKWRHLNVASQETLELSNGKKR